MAEQQKIEGIPDGWELVRIGKPISGNTIIGNDGKPHYCDDENFVSFNFAIIRKATTWRPAKPSDLDNGPVECRWKAREDNAWKEGVFSMFDADCCSLSFFIKDNAWVEFCEVQDNA